MELSQEEMTAYQDSRRILGISLDAQVDSAAEFGRLAAGWLTETREVLFPDLDQGLKAGRALFRRDPRDEFYLRRGESGAVWAELWVQRKPQHLGGSKTLYSDRAWQRLLDGLEAAYPFHIYVEIIPLDEAGAPPALSARAGIKIDRLHDHPQWMRFSAFAGRAVVPELASAAGRQRWADFSRRWAALAAADFGQVIENVTWLSDLEIALHANSDRTVPRSHEVLRGYSWVTVCAAVLAQCLGGAAALDASGAFFAVHELPGGSVWLQATPDIEDYDQDAVRRVFDVLAPVLMPGRVEPEEVRPGMRLVAGVDAAEYR